MSLENTGTKTAGREYRKTILRVGIVFIVVLILLTFFSKTILTLTLPRVATAEPVSGPLIKELRAEGTLSSTEEIKVYPEARKRVLSLRVKSGDSVRAGAVLAVLNAGEMQEVLAEVLAAYKRGDGTVSELVLPIAEAGVKSLDGAVNLARMKVDGLTTRLKDIVALQTEGLESTESVNRTRLELTQASQELAERQEAREQKRDSILKDLQSSIIIAPEDSKVAAVYAEQGGWVDPSQPMMRLFPKSAGLELEIAVPADLAKLVETGEHIRVIVKSRTDETAEGRIVHIADNVVKISIPRSTELRAGEAADVSMQKQTRPYAMLVPNSAVGRDAQGQFVWILKEKQGALGSEYFAVRSGVSVEDSDDFMTAVTSGVEELDKLIVRSSKPISGQGSRVILE